MEKNIDTQVSVKIDTSKPAKVATIADKIWDDIRDERLDIFALPKQFVEMYCEPVAIEPNAKLYLKFTVPAVLPALETALKDDYKVEMIDKYICVTPIVKE
jgi:hypothetical protein